MDSSKYDKNYYEHGVEQHISGYQNYHWMPTRSYPEAMQIIRTFGCIDSIIEIGCAKGFLVHALRQLGRNAYGEDISDYAIENAYPPVKEFVTKPTDRKADLIICKDILEHIPESDMNEFLQSLLKKTKLFLLAVIPLGDDNLFRIREYEIDVTHVTKKDEDWWINKFKENGFRIVSFDYSLGCIKEKWTKQYPYGNGFFILQK